MRLSSLNTGYLKKVKCILRFCSIVLPVCLILFSGISVAADDEVPTLPQPFYGTVTVNGSPAADGTVISATVDQGTIRNNAQNPVITQNGNYGVSTPPLLVQGIGIPNGATITFYVITGNGIAIGGTYPYTAGGTSVQMDLNVTINIGGGGGTISGDPEPESAPPPVADNTQSLDVDETGILRTGVTVAGDQAPVSLTISVGTKCQDEAGAPLGSVTAEIVSPQTVLSERCTCIAACNLGPDGATFDPPLTITFSYSLDQLKELNITEDEITIAVYNETTREWNIVSCIVDRETHQVTAAVSHFSLYGLVALPIEETTDVSTGPGESTETTTVQDDSDGITIIERNDDVPSETQESDEQVEALAPEDTADEGSGVNWWIVGGSIFGGIIIILGIVVYIMWKKEMIA